MKKVVVTGANGFIGSYTLNLLVEKGYEVHAISSKNLKKKIATKFFGINQIFSLKAKLKNFSKKSDPRIYCI